MKRDDRFFKLLSCLMMAFVGCTKIDAPDCSSVNVNVNHQKRKLYIAACESKWGPEVSDAYNITSFNMIRKAHAEHKQVEIINVCANLNWKKLGFLTKPLKYLNYAKEVLKDTEGTDIDATIIFSDSDTFWNVGSVDQIFQKYDCIRHGKELVMATESTCWVGRYCTEEDMKRFYSGVSAPSYSAFVNSGLLIGSPLRLYDMFSEIVERNGSAFIPKYKGTMKYDDQMAFVQYYDRHRDIVALDYHQHLFGSIVTSHKSERTHTIPFVCVKQDSPPAEDIYDFNCDDMTSKAQRLGSLRLNPSTCLYVRHAEALKSDPRLYEAYRTLAGDPVIWHGNGAGKRAFHNLRPRLKECFARNFGI